jgi:membrane-associated phospholipid phosphatase
MQDNDQPETVPVPPMVYRASLWAAHRRRPAFLLLLLSGLILFILFMPSGTRASLWTDFIQQRTLMFLLIIFALVSLSLIWSAGQRLDMRVFKLFNLRGYPKWLDRLMLLGTQLGNMVTALIAALIFFLLGYHDLAIEIVLGTLTLWLLVEIVKSLADRDRPFLTFVEARIVGWRERGDSFPSGHTTQVFFLATILIHHFEMNVPAALTLYSIAALVGFTRIYVGAHYPRDVIAGMVLGCVWGLLGALLSPYWLVLRF